MSRALDYLAKIRMAGKKPGVVFLLVGGVQPKFWLSDIAEVEIAVPADASAARMDFRPLVGCNVIVIAERRTQALRSLVKRLEPLCVHLTVYATETLPGELGRAFERGKGWREMGVNRG